MTTKKELVDELSRLTGDQKKSFSNMSKGDLIILLHKTRTSHKHRKSHVRMSSPKRRRSASKRKSRRRRSRTSYRNSKEVSWGGKHVYLNSHVPHRRSSGRRSRGILRPKRSYRAKISYSPRKTKRQILDMANKLNRTRMSRSRKVRSPTKKYYVDEIARITGSKKSAYNEWSKEELKQRLEALSEEHWTPTHGKHVWLETPPKRLRSRSRRKSHSRRKSRSSRKSRRQS